MKQLILAVACVLFSSAFARAVDARHLKSASGGVTWADFYINNADKTPITTAQRAALISSTSLTSGDFVAVSLTQDEIALATSTYNCSYTGSALIGEVSVEGLRLLLTDKAFIRSWAFDIDLDRMLTRQSSGFVDQATLDEIQKYKSHAIFLKRIYLALP